ncbi:hypothetical protein ACFQ0G_04340 [Streptomyces chiangmaiensis]
MSRTPHFSSTSATSSGVTHRVTAPSRTWPDFPTHGCTSRSTITCLRHHPELLATFKQRHWPGTSKWNKVEHRLFSRITCAWRGIPLTSHEVAVRAIAAARTRTGLRVRAELDTHIYPTGQNPAHWQVAALPLTRDDFHGDWNYTLHPAPEPQPPPPSRSIDPATTAWLSDPALTGMPRQELDSLVD